MNSVSSLEGKVAIVTGAGQGMGEHFARSLAARGASVVVTDLNAEHGEAVAADLRDSGTDARFVSHDVSNAQGWATVLSVIDTHHGKVDILVNNAGLINYIPIEDLPIEVFDRILAVNVRGAFLGCKLVLPLMKKAGRGAIINIASIAGMIATSEGSAAYSTSKGAVRALTKAVAIDYIRYNIRVNAILPGSVDTPATHSFLVSKDPEMRKMALGRTPMARAALPSEIAHAVTFLASDAASFMTGAEMVIDGGWTAC